MKYRKPTLKVGLGGNFYVICDIKEPLIKIVDQIQKSRNSIYYNKKYQVWAIRCKSKQHKEALRNIAG